MVKSLTNKPDGYFKDSHSDSFLWFEFTYKNDPYAYVAIEVIGAFASAHTEMVRWSHNIAKTMKADWEEIKNICRSLGVKEVAATNNDINDKRWPKFIRLFGFDEPKPILVSRQEI
jgi:hypothetical protein